MVNVPRVTDADVLMLQAAADPTRLRMLRQLARGDVCACDFTADATVTQPTISHHLRVLREAGWVDSERHGTWIWYSLRADAVARFRALADQMELGPGVTEAAGRRQLPVVEAGRS